MSDEDWSGLIFESYLSLCYCIAFIWLYILINLDIFWYWNDYSDCDAFLLYLILITCLLAYV